MPSGSYLTEAYESFHRSEKLRRVVAHPVLEDQLDVADGPRVERWVSLYDHEIGDLALGHRPKAVELAEHSRPVRGHDTHGLDRREPGLDQKLEVPLIAQARQHAAVSGWIHPGGE